jgi:glycosyltransferase involved in cell wall biosynthesis
MKFSIIIPNFNKEQYVLECIQSCLNQTYSDLEIIFIDNESTDSSLRIVREFKERSGSSFVIDVAKNIYPRCWDECVDLAKGKYVSGEYYTIVGSDDAIHEKYVENCVKYIEETKANVFQSQLFHFSDGQIVNRVSHSYGDLLDLKKHFVFGCYVNSPTVVYKTGFLESKGLIPNPTKYSGASDYDLYCQIVDSGEYIFNSAEWLGYFYRINPTQATHLMQQDEIKYDKLIQKKWKDKWNLNL